MALIARIERSGAWNAACVAEKLESLGYEAAIMNKAVIVYHVSRSNLELKKALSAVMNECKVTNSVKVLYGNGTMTVSK